MCVGSDKVFYRLLHYMRDSSGIYTWIYSDLIRAAVRHYFNVSRLFRTSVPCPALHIAVLSVADTFIPTIGYMYFGDACNIRGHII